MDTFLGFDSILTLRLFGNEFTSLEVGVFNGLTSLTTLYINNNPALGSLPAGLFAPFASTLENLHSKQCNIRVVELGSVSALTHASLLIDMASNPSACAMSPLGGIECVCDAGLTGGSQGYCDVATAAPVTAAPVTPAPVTSAPVTSAPVSPVTAAPNVERVEGEEETAMGKKGKSGTETNPGDREDQDEIDAKGKKGKAGHAEVHPDDRVDAQTEHDGMGKKGKSAEESATNPDDRGSGGSGNDALPDNREDTEVVAKKEKKSKSEVEALMSTTPGATSSGASATNITAVSFMVVGTVLAVAIAIRRRSTYKAGYRQLEIGASQPLNFATPRSVQRRLERQPINRNEHLPVYGNEEAGLVA